MSDIAENLGGFPRALQDFTILEQTHRDLMRKPDRTPAEQAVFMILDSEIALKAGNVSVEDVCGQIHATADAILAAKLRIETARGLL